MLRSRSRAGWKVIVLLLFLASVFALDIRGVFAADDQPPGPDRFAAIQQDYTSYKWWLIDWEDNKVACKIVVDHDGLPTADEIYAACGKDIYKAWAATEPCPESETDPQACVGYYLHLVKSEAAQREVGEELPPPVVWVTLEGCVPEKSTFRCDSLPKLVLTGEEPLQEEHITGIAGRIDGEPFLCDAVCQVDLSPTDEDGVSLEFWAYSSYGDSSILYTARVRVIASDDLPGHSWYADVLSSQWRGMTALAGCSQIWGVFPPVGGTPDWLSTPQRPEDLATTIPYEYLAVHLIKQGVVDASACNDGGFLENGNISPCGLETARPAINDWQNRFDDLIFSAAQGTGVPAQLLKNIFSRESQFWPGMVTGHPEAGLGQMTEGGADATLLWNRPFFEQFCPSVLDDAVCRTGYPHLEEEQQEQLRTALVDSVNAFCPDCPLGIDLDRAEHSVEVFAETLLANCEQAGMVAEINYGSEPEETASYEDLWRFTLVNYNGGPGCLGLAIDETSNQGEELTWENVASHLTRACQGAADYVTDISNSLP